MTWDKDLPAGSTKLRLADDQIRENNDCLEDALSRDHNFPGTKSVDAGEHARVKFTAPVATPTNAANKGYLYIKDVGGKAELHFLDEDGNEIQLTGGGISQSFPSGTEMVFIQNAAPTGWTRNAARQDNAMLCYAATGNPASGGSINPQSTHAHAGPSHTHTGPSHTHSGPSHTHTGPSHTHTGPNHQHEVPMTGETNNIRYTESAPWGSGASVQLMAGNTAVNAAIARHCALSNAAGTGATGADGTGATGADGTGATGAAGTGATGADGTGATGSSTAPFFQECISATKD